MIPLLLGVLDESDDSLLFEVHESGHVPGIPIKPLGPGGPVGPLGPGGP
jgi:hypothetical protein